MTADEDGRIGAGDELSMTVAGVDAGIVGDVVSTGADDSMPAGVDEMMAAGAEDEAIVQS